jgi:hypothetical protein
MAYIFQWDILETEVSNYDSLFPDTVKRIKFAFVAYDVESQGDETTFIMKDIYLSNPKDENFTPFSELKHADFVSFVIDACGESDIDFMKRSMIAELEERKIKKLQKNQIKSPWSDQEIAIEQNVPKFDNQLEYLLNQTLQK